MRTISANACSGRRRGRHQRNSLLLLECRYQRPGLLFRCHGGCHRIGRLDCLVRTDCCVQIVARRPASLCDLVIRGLVVFRDPRTLPTHPVTGRVLVAGILGADKKDGAQRFLLDRRPLNAVEERLHGLPLPFAGDFVRVELGPDEVIRTSLRDGKDHYNILRQADGRIPWQAFGQPVDNDWFPEEPAVRNGAPWLQPRWSRVTITPRI